MDPDEQKISVRKRLIIFVDFLRHRSPRSRLAIIEKKKWQVLTGSANRFNFRHNVSRSSFFLPELQLIAYHARGAKNLRRHRFSKQLLGSGTVGFLRISPLSNFKKSLEFQRPPDRMLLKYWKCTTTNLCVSQSVCSSVIQTHTQTDSSSNIMQQANNNNNNMSAPVSKPMTRSDYTKRTPMYLC